MKRSLRKPVILTFYFFLVFIGVVFFPILYTTILSTSKGNRRYLTVDVENYEHLLSKLALLEGKLNAFDYLSNETDRNIFKQKSDSGFRSYFPHLQNLKVSISPEMLFSKGRSNVSYVFGIPTIQRPKGSFFETTLRSLITNLTAAEQNETLLVIFVADKSTENIVRTISSIQVKFQNYLDSGLIDIIVPPSHFYPNMNVLPILHGDAISRARFRSKQVLDYAYLMHYAKDKGKYYIQLEDDVLPAKNYLIKIKEAIKNNENKDWILLHFSSLGFIGKLFRSKDLNEFIDYMCIFWNRQPVDLLISHYLTTKMCTLGNGDKKCKVMKNKAGIEIKPSLFQHIGKYSSFQGKKNLLHDKNFKS